MNFLDWLQQQQQPGPVNKTPQAEPPANPFDMLQQALNMIAQMQHKGGIMPAKTSPNDTFYDRLRQQDPYSAVHYTPQQIGEYFNVLYRNAGNLFPSRTDVPADYFRHIWGSDPEHQRGGSRYARQDSLYQGERIANDYGNNVNVQEDKLAQALVKAVQQIYGQKNVSIESKKKK